MSTTKKNKSGDGWTQKLEENIFSSQPAVDWHEHKLNFRDSKKTLCSRRATDPPTMWASWWVDVMVPNLSTFKIIFSGETSLIKLWMSNAIRISRDPINVLRSTLLSYRPIITTEDFTRQFISAPMQA
jgi:hypothetical protein